MLANGTTGDQVPKRPKAQCSENLSKLVLYVGADDGIEPALSAWESERLYQ
jgi:hypothetical protein